MLPIVEAMQLLTDADYQPLGPLIENHEFPLLVKKQQVVYVAKLNRPDALMVLEKLRDHPIIRMPQLTELLTTDDLVVSIETLINGETLATALTTTGAFKPETVLKIAQELLTTLAKLAELGIVHRDIKLSNIMIHNGHYYLIDVDAAREYHDHQSSDTRLLGTSGFAAPENYGFAQTDQRSDIYSLGVVLNCLLTGKVPVDSQARLTDVTTVEPWHTIITTATALDPNQRYQTAEAMLISLTSKPTNRRKKADLTVKRLIAWWQNLKAKLPVARLKKIGWWLYGLFMVVVVLASLDWPTWSQRLLMLWASFAITVLPVIFHFGNRWLHSYWTQPTWHRYRIWLRAAEFVVWVYLVGLGN